MTWAPGFGGRIMLWFELASWRENYFFNLGGEDQSLKKRIRHSSFQFPHGHRYLAIHRGDFFFFFFWLLLLFPCLDMRLEEVTIDKLSCRSRNTRISELKPGNNIQSSKIETRTPHHTHPGSGITVIVCLAFCNWASVCFQEIYLLNGH